MSIDVLKEDLKNNKIGNLYLFYGPEEYLKKYYLSSIEKSLLSEDMKTLNRIQLEGKIDLGNLKDHCETMPVFSEKKVVIVKNSGFFKPKKKSGDGEGKAKGSQEELASYLQNVPEYTCMIFYEEEIDKRIKLVDTIKKNGLLVEFAFQKPAELVKWVSKALKSYKKDIDPMTASLLVENSENGMTEILNEISKLVLYTGERSSITRDDIEKVCTKSVKSRIFDLTDAVAEKNTAKALRLLEDMVVLKEPLPKILFMITRQFRQVLEMKLLKNEGLRPDAVASKMGVTPYAAGKILRYTGVFSVDELKRVIKESLELDVAVKTGKIRDRIAAELLITMFSKR